MKMHSWKNAISSGIAFIIIGVIVLGLVAGSVALSPNMRRTTNQVRMTQSSSFPPLPSSVYSTSSTSSSSSKISSSQQTSSSESFTSTTVPTTSYTTSSQSTSRTVITSTATASLVLAPTSGPPGSQFTFTFTGGKAATQYHEESFSQPNISFTTNSGGSFIGTITVPLSEQPHGYAVKVKDSNHNVVVEATFTVTTTTTTSTPTTTASSTSSTPTSTTFSSSSTSTITTSITITTISTTIASTSTLLGSLPIATLALIPLLAVFQRKNVIFKK